MKVFLVTDGNESQIVIAQSYEDAVAAWQDKEIPRGDVQTQEPDRVELLLSGELPVFSLSVLEEIRKNK